MECRCSSQVHHTLKEVFSDRLVLIRPHFRQGYERLHVHSSRILSGRPAGVYPRPKGFANLCVYGRYSSRCRHQLAHRRKDRFHLCQLLQTQGLAAYQLQTGLKSRSRHHVSFGPLCDRILLYFQQKQRIRFSRRDRNSRYTLLRIP